MQPSDVQYLTTLDPSQLASYSDSDLLTLGQQLLDLQAYDRQTNQIRYYQPVSDLAKSIHTSTQRVIGIGGGNGSSKTDTALAEMVIRITGQIPLSLRDTYPRAKLRGPIAARVVCESLTTTLEPIILPKLNFQRWSGVDAAGGARGHWGWIPQHCLVNGHWKDSWKERTRTLRVFYRDPDEPARILGESLVQFMSYDQDPTDFASGDFHFILHDEPPKYEIWRENRARVMRVDGTAFVAMTWPDDPAINVDWIFDEIYDKAQQADPDIGWYTLYTTDNPHLNQDAVSFQARQMGATERQARIYGQPIRLSNRVHPLFTDTTRYWCVHCLEDVITNAAGMCGDCGSRVVPFLHVQSLAAKREYPCIYALDPHPRKPHCMLWCQVTPNDDLAVIHELEVDGGPNDVWDAVKQVEKDYEWVAIRRLIDPNMGRSPSDAKRELTWQEAFEQVGLVCDLADDSDVGRRRVDEYLRPDDRLEQPRLLVDPRCTKTIYQLKRYLWSDYKRGDDHGVKQKPKDKHDDYPTLLKYIANSDPTHRSLLNANVVYRHHGTRTASGY